MKNEVNKSVLGEQTMGKTLVPKVNFNIYEYQEYLRFFS